METHFRTLRTDLAQEIAAYVQREFERALQDLLARLITKHVQQNVVLSGGIGLNCVANTKLRHSFPAVKDFFIFPACSDTGLAVGNALFADLTLTGQFPKPPDRSMLFGRFYCDDEIRHALERRPDTVPPGEIRLGELEYCRSEHPIADAAKLLADGKILGWWQGRSECGPRALGSRSILASPIFASTAERLNARIKKREWFRPFGPSMLPVVAASSFTEVRHFPYMIEAPTVTTAGRNALGVCVHVDGTARAQVVQGEAGNRFFQLLHEIDRNGLSGCLLNIFLQRQRTDCGDACRRHRDIPALRS